MLSALVTKFYEEQLLELRILSNAIAYLSPITTILKLIYPQALWAYVKHIVFESTIREALFLFLIIL